MNWDQQALEAWLEESARQDEDAMTIAKYARADEGKIRVSVIVSDFKPLQSTSNRCVLQYNNLLIPTQDLTLKMERLHDLMTKKKRMLDNEMIESVTAQIELDKTAESFRNAHHEREELIKQWEQTIQQMRKRDEDMDKCANVS